MRLFDRIREYLRRHNDLSAGRDPVWDDAPEQAPTETMPAAAEDAPTAILPSQMQDAQYDAEARRKVAELAAQVEAERAQAAAEAWREADPIASLPPAPLPEPPPMPPSDLSRIMVAQIPSPPPNDRNFAWTHEYADYMRRVGVATGTSTDLEHTMAWGIPALKPGDGTGVRLAAQEHGETGPEVAA